MRVNPLRYVCSSKYKLRRSKLILVKNARIRIICDISYWIDLAVEGSGTLSRVGR